MLPEGAHACSTHCRSTLDPEDGHAEERGYAERQQGETPPGRQRPASGKRSPSRTGTDVYRTGRIGTPLSPSCAGRPHPRPHPKQCKPATRSCCRRRRLPHRGTTCVIACAHQTGRAVATFSPRFAQRPNPPQYRPAAQSRRPRRLLPELEEPSTCEWPLRTPRHSSQALNAGTDLPVDLSGAPIPGPPHC